MKKILLIVFLGIAFSTLIFAQDVRYEAYLKKNHLAVPSTDATIVDGYDLLDSCKIKFSSNESLIYADMITKDTIVRVSEADFGNPKLLGSLYADFDNCFFWGCEIDHGLYGNIIYKSNPYFRIDKLFVYVDANIKHSVLILADANCEGGCPKTTFVFNAKTGRFTTYLLKKEIPQGQFKYIRFVSIAGNTITLKDIITNELFKGTKNRSALNSGISN